MLTETKTETKKVLEAMKKDANDSPYTPYWEGWSQACKSYLQRLQEAGKKDTKNRGVKDGQGD